MVYVAMDVKDLRIYQDPPRPIHARLGGIHEQPYNRYRGIQASPEQLTLSDALRDPEIATAADGSFSPFPQEEPDDHTDEDPYYGSEIFGQTGPEAHCDIPSPPSNAVHTTFSDGGSLSFTLVSTDEESGPEDNSPQEVLDYRLQRLRRMSRRHDMDDWEPPGPSWAYSRADGSTSHEDHCRGSCLLVHDRAIAIIRHRPRRQPKAARSAQKRQSPLQMTPTCRPRGSASSGTSLGLPSSSTRLSAGDTFC
jgi:hypothetical protein